MLLSDDPVRRELRNRGAFQLRYHRGQQDALGKLRRHRFVTFCFAAPVLAGHAGNLRCAPVNITVPQPGANARSQRNENLRKMTRLRTDIEDRRAYRQRIVNFARMDQPHERIA